MDDAGNFVVVWDSHGQVGPCCSKDVFAQLFDSDGSRVGSELQVNTYTSDDQRDATVAMDAGGEYSPVVAMDDDGNITAAWTEFDSEGAGFNGGIFGQLLDAAPLPVCTPPKEILNSNASNRARERTCQGPHAN